LEFNGAKIQVLDVPGIIEGVSGGKGRGKEILAVIRNADLVLIMTSADKDTQKRVDIIARELYESGFRLNKNPPEVKITRKSTGGVRISSTVKQELTNESIRSILNTFGIINAEVLIREKVDQDKLIDGLMKNRVYVPAFVIVNKVDKQKNIKLTSNMDVIKISAMNGLNTDLVKRMIWDKLGLIRVFLKRIGKEPDLKVPLIVKHNSTVGDVCRKIHKEFYKDFKHARVWGSSRFPGQKVGIDYKLIDKDIVELHL